MDRCIEAEQEYRAWRECPQWYCVKTTYSHDGAIRSEMVLDEKTQLPFVIQDAEKPADGVYETMTATEYYTYHMGYDEALRQINIGKCG